jgi:hypothetical protein
MTFTLRPGVHLTPTGDGAVLLNERTGTYWMLNTTGAGATADLLRGADVGQAADRLAAQHPDLSPEQAAADIAALVAALRAAGLVATS